MCPQTGTHPAIARPPHEIGAQDLHLWNEGRHLRAYRKLGAHLAEREGRPGVAFAVWAPNAAAVSVIGDWNGWQPDRQPLAKLGGSGIWSGFVPGVGKGAHYKFHIRSLLDGYAVAKADPFGFHHETPPETGSVVWDLDHAWGDQAWMRSRGQRNAYGAPISIYEVHLGSWRRDPADPGRLLSYREIAPLLAAHCVEMGFTHVEFMPVMEHPFYASWGYQVTGFFAPSSRYGTPQDFMVLVDTLHQAGVGVILDYVPAHFPSDEHGLVYFDGTHLFEHADRRQGHHPDWKSEIFNYGRHEVRSFLESAALFWLDAYHVDGLRMDAVASMLYLDYSRKEGEWIPNPYGGRENLDAIAFLRQLNADVYREYPDVQTYAEESTSWPMVSRPLYVGGLGFGYKWDMGWMHDTLGYMKLDPIHRKYHHNELTFRTMYASSENFVLPLSHDEVVHMKGSLLGKMAGEDRGKFANLRLLYAWMYAQGGKKLLFMGAEFAQGREWAHDQSLDWHLTGEERHAGVMRFVQDLNRLYRTHPAMHRKDCLPGGFEWIDCGDWEHSVLSIVRQGDAGDPPVVAVFNFTPVARERYRVGFPLPGRWREILNGDAGPYGGSGIGNMGEVTADEVPLHGRPASATLTLPPLAGVFFTPVEAEKGPAKDSDRAR